jgi:aryl-alcohol dehydrogenase-like predicted oxidoreductase
MRKRTLGDGLEVSALGLGCMGLYPEHLDQLTGRQPAVAGRPNANSAPT